MVRFYLLLIAASLVLNTTGCGGFDSLSNSSSSDSNTLSQITAALKAGGLTDAEASAIEGSISSEVGSGSSKVSSQKATIAVGKLPDIIKAAMKALGLSAFKSNDRKKLAIKLIASQILLAYKEDLKGLSTDALEEMIENCIEQEVKNSSNASLTGVDRDEAIQDMVKQSMSASKEFTEDVEEKQKAVMRSLANGAINQLSSAGLTSSEIASTIPKIVEAGLAGVSAISSTTEKKKDLEQEFVLRSFDALTANVASTDLVTVSTNISTVVSTSAPTNTTLISQVSTIKDENKSCTESAKFVYMFEYSDSRCQTLSRKFIQGPMQSSPLNKGFPNHGFCYRDPSNGLYYNWIGAPAGCSTTPPEFSTFPTIRPSPKNLTAGTVGTRCSWMFATGGGSGSDTNSQAACESNALLNFKNNSSNKHAEIQYAGKMVAVFDIAPVGLTFPNISKLCSLHDFTSGIAMHNFYSRDSLECLAQCRDIVSEVPTSKYICKLDGVTIKTYEANEVPLKVAVTITKRLKLTAPSPVPRDTCVKIGVELTDLSGNLLAGSGQAIGFYTSLVIYPAGVTKPLAVYSNSTCSTPVSVPSLAVGAEANYFYIKVDSAATSVEIGVEPTQPGIAPVIPPSRAGSGGP